MSAWIAAGEETGGVVAGNVGGITGTVPEVEEVEEVTTIVELGTTGLGTYEAPTPTTGGGTLFTVTVMATEVVAFPTPSVAAAERV